MWACLAAAKELCRSLRRRRRRRLEKPGDERSREIFLSLSLCLSFSWKRGYYKGLVLSSLIYFDLELCEFRWVDWQLLLYTYVLWSIIARLCIVSCLHLQLGFLISNLRYSIPKLLNDTRCTRLIGTEYSMNPIMSSYLLLRVLYEKNGNLG